MLRRAAAIPGETLQILANFRDMMPGIDDREYELSDWWFDRLFFFFAEELHLIKMWLECAVEETDDRGGKTRTTEARDNRRGIPQGSPISPLLANLYMRRFVLGWKMLGLGRSLGSACPNHRVPQSPAPLAPSSLVGLGRVSGTG
jgi:hypothetical protein